MAMSDEGFEHAMRVFSRGHPHNFTTAPLAPKPALIAFLERLNEDKPMHINEGLALVGEGTYRNALLTIVTSFPKGVVLQAWQGTADKRPSPLKKTIDKLMGERSKAKQIATDQLSEHHRRERIRGDGENYPKNTQTAEQRKAFVEKLLGRR